MSLTRYDLPNLMTGQLVRSSTLKRCDKCDGLGIIESEELTDYHKREYSTIRKVCKPCEGDGRIVEIKEYIKMDVPNEKIRHVSYAAALRDKIDPHENDSIWFRMHLDNREYILENKYPDLAAISYEKYDKLIDHYRTIEILKKD